MTEDERRRAVAYQRWLRTPEALVLRYHKPYNYETLLRSPDNFKEVREAFHLVWITQKLTS